MNKVIPPEFDDSWLFEKIASGLMIQAVNTFDKDERLALELAAEAYAACSLDFSTARKNRKKLMDDVKEILGAE